jgi:hypothetical protein
MDAVAFMLMAFVRMPRIWGVAIGRCVTKNTPLWTDPDMLVAAIRVARI